METTPSRRLPADAYLVTEDGLRELKRELDELQRLKRGEVADELREARGFGPPDANDELWAIREEEAILDARIARLAAIVSRARVVDRASGQADVAAVGSVLHLEDRDTGTTSRYRVVGVRDTSREPGVRSISASSPVGRAVIGQRAGAHVVVELPGGGRREFRLARVAESSAEELRAAS